jgi:hypothetical protein
MTPHSLLKDLGTDSGMWFGEDVISETVTLVFAEWLVGVGAGVQESMQPNTTPGERWP